MRILLNHSSIYKGGAEQVAASLIEEFSKLENDNCFFVFLPKINYENIKKDDINNKFKFYIIDKRTMSSISAFFNIRKKIREVIKKEDIDCVLSTGGHGYFNGGVTHIGGFNIPHYIYPESPYFIGMGVKKRIYWFIMRKIHLFFYKRLNAIIVQTDDVNERLKK